MGLHTRVFPSFLSDFGNPISAVNAANDHLSSVFVKRDAELSNKFDFMDISDEPRTFFIHPNSVYKAIVTYSTNKSIGSDLIPIKLYKSVAHCISNVVCHIFNECIRTCTFPDIWKVAHISCIPKIPNASITDIRPISLLPFLSKIFERFLFDQYSYIFLNNFGKNQFGFRPKSSTACALIYLHDFITKRLDEPDYNGVQLLCYDFTRALDKVSHDVILKRLCSCNFPRSFVALMSSYLTDRRQHVRIGSTISNPTSVTSGVPQGSVLGPALFSLVVSTFDCQNSINCVVKYADDFAIACPLYSNANNYHVLEEHNNFCNWAASNLLLINHSKSKCIVFGNSQNAQSLPTFSILHEIKLLGVYFSSDLKWDCHIRYILRIATRRLYALRILKNVINRENLTIIYQALIRSTLEYCSPLFVGLNVKNSILLEKIQTRAHSIICNNECICTYHSLKERRILAARKLLDSISNDNSHILFSILPRKSTNCIGRFIQPYSRTARRSKSFFPFIVDAINSLI